MASDPESETAEHDGAPPESETAEQAPPDPGAADGVGALPDPGDVTVVEIQEEMEGSFIDYAMSVIVSRALPDARDGLKPVHRRILWSMFGQGFRPDRGHVKCARVVGDVMARFHPHGDSAIYDALARMAQPFSLRHPLIDFHGNYGSPEDPPAAARYTECRLDPLALSMLAGIDESTVDFVANYSGDFVEPSVLPARLPNLLVNGSQGIAVGMATSIPPHNLGEIIDAVEHLLDHPGAGVDDLLGFVTGPDFPTGASILGRGSIESAYRTGRGSVKMRAAVEVTEIGRRTALVVTELPYQVSAGAVARKIAALVADRQLDGIADVNDESSGDDTRFVITLKRDANPEVVLNNLWKKTPLQSSFSVNLVALVDGVPRTLTLRDALAAYTGHQIEVVTRRTEHRLAAARSRLHILEGLIAAVDLIDEVIAAIRASQDRAEARGSLMVDPFGLSEIQANYVLDMELGRLTRLGRDSLTEEASQKRAIIEEMESILARPALLRQVIRGELAEVKDKFAGPRRTVLEIDPGEVDIEDLIDDDDLVFTISASGYAKTVPVQEFRSQGRGGRGVAGARLKEADTVTHLIHTTAHSYLLFFTNRGRVHRLKAHQIPVASRTGRGTAIVNLLSLQKEERVQAVIDTRDYETNRYLFFATARGRVKKTSFTAYDSQRRDGLIAVNLNDDDELVAVMPTNGRHDVMLTTQMGQTIRFAESEVRAMGRSAAGVIGVKFKHDGDRVVGCDLARSGAALLYVTELGYGKRTPVEEFPRKHRGGLGMIGIKLTDGKGPVVGTLMVDPGDEALAITSNGVMIRTPADCISAQSRFASGVKMINPDPGDRVMAIEAVTDLAAEPDAVEPGDPEPDGVEQTEPGQMLFNPAEMDA